MKRIVWLMKNLYTGLGIKYKLFIALSMIMVVYFLITIITQQVSFHIYDEQIYRKSSQVLNLSSSSIEYELKKMENLSFNIMADKQIQAYLKTLRREMTVYEKNELRKNLEDKLLSYYTGSEPYIHSIQMIAAGGEEFTAGIRILMTSPERKAQILSDTSEVKGRNVWIYPTEQDSSLIAAREIRSYSSFDFHHLGVLLIRIDMRRIIRDITQGELHKGYLIIRSGNDTIFPEPSVLPLPHETIRFGRDSGYEIAEFDGKKYFLAFKKSDYTHWTYINVVPFHHIFKQIIWLKNIVIFILAVIFVFVVMGGMRFARSITNPIEDLIVRMGDLEQGKFDKVKAETKNSLLLRKDEIGMLYRNFRKMTRRIQELIKENYASQLTIKETEYKALQAQINPHFLYNTLESIKWSAQTGRKREIAEMVDALGFLLRSSINMKDHLLTIEEEVEIVQNYVAIQKIRYKDRLDFQTAIPPHFGTYRIPKFTLQPLVENAIKYALEPLSRPCKIRLYGIEKSDCLLLIVEDNGPGMEQPFLEQVRKGEIQTKGEGIGLKNIDERIRMALGEAYGIHIHSEPGRGTKVIVRLPNEKEDHHYA